MDHENSAVVPNEVALTDLMAEIECKRLKCQTLGSLPFEKLKQLYQEFTVEYTYDSNAIEGSPLTLAETAQALSGHTVDRQPLKFSLDACGHRDGFQYITEAALKDAPLSESVIKTIHSHVLMCQPEEKGLYRHQAVRIMGAYHIPPKPEKIEQKIKDLLLLNEKRKVNVNLFERLALFHLEFEGIHPFIDGNGRTGRLLLNFELIKKGYPAIDIRMTDRYRYYDAFDSFYCMETPAAMVRLIAESLILSYGKLLKAAGQEQ